MKPECDLVLLTWNHIETTKRAIESLFQHTDLPSRLVIVDNGSDQEGAKEYLQSVKARGSIVEVIYIRNPEDFGYSKGINVGLRFCLSHQPAPYLCCLNNDIVTTGGWLSELVRIARLNPTIGMVSATSGDYGVLLPSKEPETINRYVMKMTGVFKGKWLELSSCIGFCLLVKKELYEKIGLYDEVFGMAYYEDTDLSKRAQAAGYTCALAQGSYVYHEGGVSFGKQHQKKSPLFLKNEEIFYSRWKMKKSLRIGYILSRKRLRDQRVLYEEMRESANQFNKIWILYRNGVEEQKIPNHWNIQRVFFRGPSFLFGFWSLIYLLVKKKKFNTVFVDDLRLLAFLKGFQGRYQGELRLLSMNNEQQIMNRPSYVICAVERGWKGMRQFALAMAEKGYHVDLILREKLPPEVRKIISSREGIQIIPCGKKIFQFRFAAIVIKRALRSRVTWLILNRPERVRKNDWLCRLVAAKPLLLEEKGNLYRLFLHGGEVTLDSLNNAI